MNRCGRSERIRSTRADVDSLCEKSKNRERWVTKTGCLKEQTECGGSLRKPTQAKKKWKRMEDN